MGISRELYSWDSHNGVQATLISTYLKMIQNDNQISMLEMYAQYVRAWNGDLDAENLLSKEFKDSNAQELLILLETLNIILGNEIIADDHLLLNGDDKLWHALGRAKNWYEVGKLINGIEEE